VREPGLKPASFKPVGEGTVGNKKGVLLEKREGRAYFRKSLYRPLILGRVVGGRDPLKIFQSVEMPEKREFPNSRGRGRVDDQTQVSLRQYGI